MLFLIFISYLFKNSANNFVTSFFPIRINRIKFEGKNKKKKCAMCCLVFGIISLIIAFKLIILIRRKVFGIKCNWKKCVNNEIIESANKIKLDMIETDDVYKIIAELPGFEKEEIEIKVERNKNNRQFLKIKGVKVEKKEEESKINEETPINDDTLYNKVSEETEAKKPENKKYIIKERNENYERDILLFQSIKEENIKAKYENGILIVTLYKSGANKIKIE
jgi:HSP20 family molecular chaperone IbpA